MCSIGRDSFSPYPKSKFPIKLKNNKGEESKVSIHLMLLFICAPMHGKYRRNPVSIHLMLLFIGTNSGVASLYCTGFNTSHVVVYHSKTGVRVYHLYCFNTSHVVVYPFKLDLGIPPYRVSIHLMLLFILRGRKFKRTWRCVSIHLMLLFITFIFVWISLIF